MYDVNGSHHCNSQDLTLHTVPSDGVATVRQTFSVRDFECYRLIGSTNVPH